MLLVKTYLGVSKQNGIGLFAGENIMKNTEIWRYNDNTTQIFWKKQFLAICSQLSNEAIVDFIKHSYIREGNVFYLNDNSRFINHSLDPNIAFRNSKSEIAIKYIKKDEELTENFFISYDENDFSRWSLPSEFNSKEDLLHYMRRKLLEIPTKDRFLVQAV